MKEGQLVIGINAAYHESSAALIQGGRVICAIEEERLNRKKHGKRARIDNPDVLPWRAINAVIRHASVEVRDIDAVAYSLVPGRRKRLVGIDPPETLDSRLGWGTEEGETKFEAALCRVPLIITEKFGVDRSQFHFIPHHLSHAASIFYTSKFEEAAVLVLDGIGEDSAGWLGLGCDSRLKRIEAIPYPHSLGLLWERFAIFLGFDEYDAAKVMGLAAYGEPDMFREAMALVLNVAAGPLGESPFRVNPDIARLRAPDVAGLERLFGPRRRPDESPTDPRFASIARALQSQTERAVLAVANRLSAKTELRDLCYTGGVALNCIANTRLEREGPFRQLSMIGAAHDAGTAIGAALETSLRIDPSQRMIDGLGQYADLGPTVTDDEIEMALRNAGLSYERVKNPAWIACTSLIRGKIVGWVQGRMEFGPRALGHRSILADPRNSRLRDHLNRTIKKRKAFQPFGASVLVEALSDWFDLPEGGCFAEGPRQLMLLAYPVTRIHRSTIPAVVHADGTCRIEVVTKERNGAYYNLIAHFYECTGVPLVLNTSFNGYDEPIVCNPVDAIKTAIGSGIDLLVMGCYVARCGPYCQSSAS